MNTQVKQFNDAISREYGIINMLWEEYRSAIKNEKDFKKMAFDESAGYERYTPQSCLFLANIQKTISDKRLEIKTHIQNIWKIERSLEKYNLHMNKDVI